MHSTSNHTMALAQNGKVFWNVGPLIFSSFFFFPLFTQWSELTWFDIACHFFIYVSFIVLYGIALFKKGTSITWVLFTMMLLCTLGTFVTYGTHSLFGFIAFFCGFNYRLKQGLAMLVCLFFMLTVSGVFIITINIMYFLLPGMLLSLGLFSFGVMEQKERIHQIEREQNQQQIEQLAAIAERERIARDLHDLLGHSLSSIALKAELASKLHQNGAQQQAADESLHVAKLARELLSEVRHAVSGLKQVGLIAQIEVLTRRLQEAGFTVVSELKQVKLTAEQESVLCFTVKEAVTNVIRHSKGKEVTIRLTDNSQYVQLTVHDTGHVKQLIHGNGLTGLKERIEQLSGLLCIDTKGGFTLTAKV